MKKSDKLLYIRHKLVKKSHKNVDLSEKIQQAIKRK